MSTPAKAPPLTEKQLMQSAIDLAHSYGWLLIHHYDSRRSEPGFPDILAVRSGELLAIECKSAKGRVTEAQQRWLNALDRIHDSQSIILRPGPTLDALAELLR